MSTSKTGKKWRRVRRKFTDEMARRLKRMSLSQGGHEEEQKKQCVMEALALVSGQEWTDYPVCVSDVIISLSQYLNDQTENQKDRNKLKKLVPIVMGTAPLVSDGTRERKDRTDPAYNKAEKKRQQMIVDFANTRGLTHLDYRWNGRSYVYEKTDKPFQAKEWSRAYYEIVDSEDVSFKDKLALIVDLARVKKFNGQKVEDFLPEGGRL